MKGETDRNSRKVKDFNTILVSMDIASRQKINKETAALNDILDQMDLIDILRAFHPKAVKCAYFSRAHGMFSRIDHVRIPNKLKKIEIISDIFSDHNGMKLEINYKKNTEQHAKTWKLNSMLLNSEWVNNDIKEEIKRYIETNENENTTIQNLWDTGKVTLRGKFIALQAY